MRVEGARSKRIQVCYRFRINCHGNAYPTKTVAAAEIGRAKITRSFRHAARLSLPA